MKILYIDHYAGSPDLGMEYRPYFLAKHWAERGHEVIIVAGSYSHLRASPRMEKSFQEETVDGVRYFWFKSPSYKGNGVKRFWSILVFLWKLFQRVKWFKKNWPPDVVIASSTYPLDHYPARKIARKTGAVLIHEVHDLWPLTLIELGGLSKKHPFIRLLQKAEDDSYHHVDKVVSILPCAKEYMKEHGLREGKFLHIPNGIDQESWNQVSALPSEHENTLKELRNEGKLLVGYAGGHGLSNDLHTLINSVAHIQNPDIQLVLAGDGPKKEEIKQEAISKGLKNLTFLPRISKQQIPALLKKFDILTLTMSPIPLYRFGVGLNKWFDYMMAGKPIVQAMEAGNDLVAEAGCGKTVKPGNPQELGKAIEAMAEIPEEERRKMGEKGRAFVLQNHEYSVLADQFLMEMKRLNKSKSEGN